MTNPEVRLRREAGKKVADVIVKIGRLNMRASWLRGMLTIAKADKDEVEAAHAELAEMRREVERELEHFRETHAGNRASPIVNAENALARLLQQLSTEN